MYLNYKVISNIVVFLFCSVNVISQDFTSSNLPIVKISTGGKHIVDDPKIIAEMGIIYNGKDVRNSINDQINDYSGKISIEIRGSSSQGFPKKSYGFETKSIDLTDLDVSLLGMPEENDWVLYAPYTDKTMIRDVLTYTLDASMGHYAPRCKYVELIVNGNYEGVYVLIEKIKRNKNRVDIAKLTDTDIEGENLTGGYIIKIDKSTGNSGEGWFSDYVNITNNTYYQFDYPKYSIIKPEQAAYIETYVKNMEESIYLQKFSGIGNYHEYLNDSSFIDFMIINELAKNIDGYRLSSYLYKGKNDRMNCGPIWDFNLTYGNADYYQGWLTTGLQYQANMGGDGWQNPFWWSKLMKDPTYVKNLKRRWTSLRMNQFSDQRINALTDSLVDLVYEAQDRNYQRWTNVIGHYVWPNYYVGDSYNEEVVWMKDWINKRLTYLDRTWPFDFTDVDNLAQTKISLFPNPFTDQLNIQISDNISCDGFIELFNLEGQSIKKLPIVINNGHFILDFSGNNDINKGLYILRITYNKMQATCKIIKKA